MNPFAAGSSMLWIVSGLAVLGGVGLFVAEYHRPDRRRRAWRLVASILAVAALTLWALRAGWPGNGTAAPVGTTAAVLWTSARIVSPVPDGIELRNRFALAGADVPGNAGVTFVPDVATLRRRFPEIRELRILGDGLEPAELPALAGLRVEFDPGAQRSVAVSAPRVLSLHCPRTLALGEVVVIEGRAGGLSSGKTGKLTLEAPDGTSTDAAIEAADAHGEAAFTIRAPAPPAVGRTLWRLRWDGNPEGETLGIAVRAPVMPRVLVLESAPRFDTALLRRWYEQAGGTLRARVRLGQDRYRFFASDAVAPAEFSTIDPALLSQYDLVVGDGRALAALPEAERENLRAAVADTGLGLLILADDGVLPPANVAPDRAWLFPWQLRSLDPAGNPAGDSTEHLARLVWRKSGGVDVAVPTASFEVVLRSGQTGAMRDDQGRVLAATTMYGRGSLALTLVRETGRWQRANAPETFAGYWSCLFERTARPLAAGERWTLVNGDSEPAFVDQPLDLTHTGALPRNVRISDESGAPPVALAPGSELGKPESWRVRFWPRRAGWHRLESDRGGVNFYVQPRGSWPELAAERRRAATERFAARTTVGGTSVEQVLAPRWTVIPAGWWFAAFFLGAGFLWVERLSARQ